LTDNEAINLSEACVTRDSIGPATWRMYSVQ